MLNTKVTKDYRASFLFKGLGQAAYRHMHNTMLWKENLRRSSGDGFKVSLGSVEGGCQLK